MDRTTYPAPSRPPVKSRPTPSTFAQTHSRALIEAEYMPPRKDGCDQRLVEINQRIHQPNLRRLSRPPEEF